MTKLTLEQQELLFANDCKLINLRYEYHGYTGTEKWAIVTELAEEELWVKYPERGAGMSKQIRNKFKYDIPIYHRPIISVDEATAYSGIGRTKLYELTTMENCPFVIWVGTRRVIKRKSFVEYLERQYSIYSI